MSKNSEINDWREKTYKMLYLIPGPENKVSFKDLSATLNDLYDNEDARDAYLDAILNFLKIFGAIIIEKVNDAFFINAPSETAQCFIRSLAQYIRKDIKIVGDWDRLGSHNDVSMSKILPSGAQFLKLLEMKRIKESPIPVRNVKVAVGIIKAKLRLKRDPVYLFQFEQHASQYKLIGGRYREEDENLSETLIREVREEIGLLHDRDFDFRELLSDVELNALSLTRGAYTHYVFNVYQIFLKNLPKLGPNDKWFTEKELKEQNMQADIMEVLRKKLPGGLASLPLSTIMTISRSWKEIIKEHIITISIIITVIATIVTLIGILK